MTSGMSFSNPMGMMMGRPRTAMKLMSAPTVPPCALLASTPALPYGSTALAPLTTASPSSKVSRYSSTFISTRSPLTKKRAAWRSSLAEVVSMPSATMPMQ